ncbi:MAG: hypothetical protein JWM53_436 [bacterium]|nr:hypothetical protein [bacterium]
MLFTTCVFAVVLIAAVLALGGTGRCIDGARLRERRAAQRGVRRYWTTRVAELPSTGDVKIEGTAVTDGGELRAPFSGRRCVAYELTLFDFEGVRPVLLARVAIARPFLLRDDTGTAHVVPEPAFVGIEPDKRWRFEADRVDGRLRALLETHALDQRWRGHPVVVCEGVIAIGGPVAAVGHVAREPFAGDAQPTAHVAAADSPYRTVGTRALLTGSMAAPLLLIPAD